MSRVIKFRAWAHASNTMFAPDADTGWELLGGEIYPVPNVTLMQFTGLHDKNGKEIYEGDILRLEYKDGPDTPENEQVEWSGAEAGFICGIFNMAQLLAENDVEVIGNIHENPELLK